MLKIPKEYRGLIDALIPFIMLQLIHLGMYHYSYEKKYYIEMEDTMIPINGNFYPLPHKTIDRLNSAFDDMIVESKFIIKRSPSMDDKEINIEATKMMIGGKIINEPNKFRLALYKRRKNCFDFGFISFEPICVNKQMFYNHSSKLDPLLANRFYSDNDHMCIKYKDLFYDENGCVDIEQADRFIEISKFEQFLEYTYHPNYYMYFFLNLIIVFHLLFLFIIKSFSFLRRKISETKNSNKKIS